MDRYEEVQALTPPILCVAPSDLGPCLEPKHPAKLAQHEGIADSLPPKVCAMADCLSVEQASVDGA